MDHPEFDAVAAQADEHGLALRGKTGVLRVIKQSLVERHRPPDVTHVNNRK
jgi:hypothetical protein